MNLSIHPARATRGKLPPSGETSSDKAAPEGPSIFRTAQRFLVFLTQPAHGPRRALISASDTGSELYELYDLLLSESCGLIYWFWAFVNPSTLNPSPHPKKPSGSAGNRGFFR